MRTKRVLAFSLIVLALFVTPYGSVLARRAAPDDDWYEIGLKSGSILRFPPVRDAPFSAEVVTVWRPRPDTGRSVLQASSRYYRDRAGRVRVEQTFIGSEGGRQPERIVIASEAGDLPVYLVDPAAREAGKVPRMFAVMTVGDFSSVVMPVSPTCFLNFSRLHPIEATKERLGQAPLAIGEESLGHQTMTGVRAAGTRYRMTVPAGLYPARRQDLQMTLDRWMSSDLGLEVYGRSEDSEGDVIERRLTAISRAESPAELFELPRDFKLLPDYRVVPAYSIRPGTIFLNPYSPDIWPARASLPERCRRPFD